MKSNIFTLIFFIIFFNIQNAKCQDEITKSYIPNITVATPQVASMSKVNEIPVDIATGKINYNIPIFEIKEGEFTMPINLSYNYSGLIVDETPGYAGVGWTFNIGGAIMHTIKGANDEDHPLDKNTIYKYFNKLAPYEDENSPQSKARILDLFEKVAEGRIDGRPDKYSINIGNIGCSFYLDKDDNPVFLKNENYKLVRNSSSGFTLTDDKGINYIFNLPQISQNTSSSSEGYAYNSSFLITEINFPYTNNKILFEYASPNNLHDLYDSYSSVNTIMNNYNNWSTTKSRTETNSTVTKLSKIITNNCTIELQYGDNPTESAVSVITKLEIKNKIGNPVNTYDFTYSQWTGRRRNLLSLKYNGQVINTMEYDESLVYPVFSEVDLSKKDLWGYYNSNGSLPLNNAPLNPLDNPGIKPNFASTKIGSLKKITYQTQGYSLIEYEPNSVFMNLIDYNFPYPSDSNISKTLTTTTTNIGGIQQVSFDVTSVPVTLNLYNVLSNDTQKSGCCERFSEVFLYMEGQESNPIFQNRQVWTKDGNWDPVQTSFTNQTRITITSPGKYFLKAGSSAGSMAHITTTLQQSAPSFDQTVGGIRVKQVKNCDFNDQCITTTYNYSQSGKSTGIMLQKPKFYSGSSFTDRRSCLSDDGTISSSTYYYSYNSVAPLSNFRGSPVLYKIVEQIEGTNNENNGKTVFSYSGISVNFLHDEGFDVGQLEEKTIKSKAGEDIQKQKNTYLNNIKPNNQRFVLGLECKAVRTTFGLNTTIGGLECSPINPRPLSDFVTETFRSESENYFLEKVDNISFLNGHELVKSTVNTYDLDTGNLKSEATKNSKKEDLITKYFYPTDSEMESEPFINELIARNLVGRPISTKSFQGGKLSEQKTEYLIDFSTANLLLPKYVYENKGELTIDNLNDKKITYDKYDEKGNVLQYTIESGMPVSIIWGYNKTQPIAKIENVAYTALEQYVSNLQNLSNQDDDNCMSSSCKEQNLRVALNSLRTNFSNAMVTTYTYNPLVGVTSITDPKAIPSYYEYDAFNRLKFIKDKDLNILQKYCYNYKGQQVDCSDNTSTSVVLYKSAPRSGSFTRNNCGAGGTGLSIPFSQAEGAVTSTISQSDADSKGLDKFNADGLANANAQGGCSFSSVALSGFFTKNSCGSAGVGSSVVYSQSAGVVISTISQANADSQALNKFNIDGQANANASGYCTFSSGALSGTFTKNNCALGGSGSSVGFNLVAGSFTSTISQADADAQALSYFNAQGQANANATGYCTFYNVARSGGFTKNNCASGGTGSNVGFSLAAGIFSSTTSQADADAQALAYFNAQGQVNANASGYCIFYSNAIGGTFTKNNCASGGTGSNVGFSLASGAVTSTVSQADADARALTMFYTNGQAYANTNGYCTFKNFQTGSSFWKNNCPKGKYGSEVNYTVPAGKYSSTISQADADNKAQLDGQAYANANGKCTNTDQ
ncbi:DUF5977 domain-containing protein [Flavobacterium geliluteum]|uniref:DUF5977 domain-containing protein n=1 Tax=Flavobacterium geliluteum TaxID=2816120 RepID=A0A940XAT7_9FLAO|nr:DUF5977 domain-containing protein [Flavobacterium geliluteum]MBP4139147.1 hypothetical protein [Flavobacterium geliluteum]